MTVSTELDRQYFNGNGSNKNFPFNFRFLDNTDIFVFLIDANGNPVAQSVGTDYTISGVGNQTGGQITFVVAPPAGTNNVLVRRIMDITQLTSIRNQGAFFPALHEDVFDRLTMMIQQANGDLGRALVMPDGQSYYDALNHRIANLADPVQAQDAATKFWTEGYVGDLVSAIQGPINNAANIFFLGADGGGHVVQDLSGTNGAAYLGWKGGQVSEFLDAGFFQPNDLDITGVADQSAKVLGYLNTYKRVRLPAGRIKMSIVVPSGCSLIGSGRTDMNRATKVWAVGGTTVIGDVGLTGSVGCVVGDMNIDCYATGGNALAGANQNTRDHFIYRVNTRANNHGQLWEQNGSDAGGSLGGNIFVMDCKHYDGPNGFVSKMKDVTFLRCLAYDVTVQAHVAVSDNINGANIYSRAQRTRFIDCGGDGCNIGLTIYSRDVFSATNANGVAGTIDTYWRGTHTNVAAGFIHVGLFRPIDAGTTALFNDQVTIDGGQYFNAPVFGVRFDDAARPRVMAGHFQNCLNPIVYGVQCVDPYVSDEVSCFGTINPGILSPYILENTNAPAVNVDIAKTLLIFQNTVATTVTSLVTSARTRTLKVLIDDNVTTLAIGGRALAGKGSVIDLHWSDAIGAWNVMSGGTQLPDAEVPFAYALNLSLFWRSKGAYVEMSGNINILDVSGSNVPKGTIVTLRLKALAAYNVNTWTGVTWGTITPVGAIASGVTVVIQMYYTGATFVVNSVNRY